MIGIICALKIEVDGLKALMEEAVATRKAGLEFISGKIFDKDVVLLECRPSHQDTQKVYQSLLKVNSMRLSQHVCA